MGQAHNLALAKPAIPGGPLAAERRKAKRFRSIIQPAKLVGPDAQQLCVVKNVSATGMMAELFRPAEKNDRQIVEFRNGKTVLARVAWAEKGHAGLEFAQRHEVEDLIAHNDRGLTPGRPRLEVQATAMLETADLFCVVPLLDISQSGAKLECKGIAQTGRPAKLLIEGLAAIEGVVRWTGPDSCGVEFEERIALPALGFWSSRLKPRKTMADYCIQHLGIAETDAIDKGWRKLCRQLR